MGERGEGDERSKDKWKFGSNKCMKQAKIRQMWPKREQQVEFLTLKVDVDAILAAPRLLLADHDGG
jgi:hypothetical protein